MLFLLCQVAAVIGDELLVEEGALQAYDLLTPFLLQHDISPLVHQALSALHITLTAVKDTAPTTIEGHSHQRMMAARTAAAVSFWLMWLSVPISPALVAGAVAGAAGGVTGRLLQPAGSFAQLNCALLKALTWRQQDPQAPAGTATPAAGQEHKPRQSATGVTAKPAKAGSKQAKAEAAAAVVAAEAEVAANARQLLSPAETAAIAKQQVEVTAAQDFVLLHPDGAAWGSPAIAAR